MPSKCLYFGGSFNPPHVAHVTCATAAARGAGLDEIVFIPTGQPQLKALAEVAPAADRLAMTRLAAADASRLLGPAALTVRVDDSEVLRSGPTYTFDTVNALAAAGVSPVHWLIGADQLLNLHRWHRVDELLHRATFWAMARPGYPIDWDALAPAVRALRDNVVVVPRMDVSATEVRRRLRAGEPVDGLLAPAVADYVRTHGLYRPPPGGAQDKALSVA